MDNANNCDIQHVDWFAQQESHDSKNISDSKKMHDVGCILHIPSMISSFNGLLTLTYMWEVAMAILLDMEVVVCNPQTTHSIAIQFHIEN